MKGKYDTTSRNAIEPKPEELRAAAAEELDEDDADLETLLALAGILGRCPTGLRVAELEEMQ